jgi:hypothetical protein
MTTVVLGWDGLDYERATAWGIERRFGAYNDLMAVYDSPALGKPHTYELWPSMITGVGRDEHGIDAAEYGAGSGWSNPLLNVAEAVSRPIPEDLRKRVGRWLRGQGATFAFETPEYYVERDLSTVFDEYDSLALAVPNYYSDVDRELGIEHDRGAALADYLTIETVDGESQHRPATSLSRLEQRLVREAGGKIAVAKRAIQQGYDLVWVWLGYLDTLGHLEPVVDEAGWLRDHYEQAAAWTATVREDLEPQDTLVCVSDHGLSEGAHRHSAFLGSDTASVVDGVSRVTDVRGAIEAVTGRTDTPSEHEAAQAAATETRVRLENLGYL